MPHRWEHRHVSLAGELLERAARAMPAAVEDRSSGWWLRHTDGGAWWSGAVLAHDATGSDLSERIVAAERFYAEHRATPRFQVCDGCPPGLDPLLAGRRYRWDSPISLRVTSCDEAVEPPQLPGFQVRVASEFDLAWLAVQSSAGTPEASAAQEARLLRRVQLPSAYVTVFAGPEPVAVGRAVADDGWTGVFSMATAPQARRRGAARLVLAVIASWARDQGAPRLYLQVERSNAPAARLYGATGFTEIATYHYRVGNRPALAGSRTGQRRE
jgi:N-acetylglutamate synthase